MWRKLLHVIKECWEFLEPVLRVKHTLEWIGWWGAVSAVGTGSAARLAHLALPEQFVLALAALLIVPPLVRRHAPVEPTIVDADQRAWVNPRKQKLAGLGVVGAGLVVIAIGIYGIRFVGSPRPVTEHGGVTSPDHDEEFETFRRNMTSEQKQELEKRCPNGSGIAVIASPDAIVSSNESHDNSGDGVCVAESARPTLTNLKTYNNGMERNLASPVSPKK